MRSFGCAQDDAFGYDACASALRMTSFCHSERAKRAEESHTNQQTTMNKTKKKNYIIAAVLLLAAILSFTTVSNAFTSDSFVAPKVQYLDEKKTTVMEMSAVAIAASAAITLVPGDAGTPIAEKLADLSKYAIIILSAVFLEKYLINLTALAAFKIIIPIGLIIIALCLVLNRKRFFQLGLRLIICGALIFAVIPASIGVSKAIESTYQMTIQQTIDTAKEDTQEIQENAEDQNAIQKFINSVKGGAKAVVDKFEKTLTNMIEAFSVMIVTSVLIPIVVYLLMWLIIKSLFFADKKGSPVYLQLPDGSNVALNDLPSEGTDVRP